ncbi:MAG: hypothetical protein AAF657_04085 [Acidobacteriota bacterium]
MELETTDYGGEEPRVSSSQMAIDGQRLKMDLGRSDDGGLNHTMVFHGGEKPRIEIFNHRDKSFLVMDPESIKALGEEMQAAMAQARDQIAALPPEQQAVVRKLLDAQLQQAKKPELPPSTVMQTSERQERQGLPCRKYDVFRDGDKIREVWVTPWGEVRGSREALAVLRDMSDFYSELMESFEKQASANFGGGFALDNHPFADLQHMEGFPVVTRNYADGSLKTEIVVKSIENQIFEPEAFLPPAGYRPTTMGPR